MHVPMFVPPCGNHIVGPLFRRSTFGLAGWPSSRPARRAAGFPFCLSVGPRARFQPSVIRKSVRSALHFLGRNVILQIRVFRSENCFPRFGKS